MGPVRFQAANDVQGFGADSDCLVGIFVGEGRGKQAQISQAGRVASARLYARSAAFSTLTHDAVSARPAWPCSSTMRHSDSSAANPALRAAICAARARSIASPGRPTSVAWWLIAARISPPSPTSPAATPAAAIWNSTTRWREYPSPIEGSREMRIQPSINHFAILARSICYFRTSPDGARKVSPDGCSDMIFGDRQQLATSRRGLGRRPPGRSHRAESRSGWVDRARGERPRWRQYPGGTAPAGA